VAPPRIAWQVGTVDDVVVETPRAKTLVLDVATSHTCESCGETNPVAKHRLYIGAGAVLRCPVCSHVAMAIATLRDRHEVHTSGAWADQVPVP
jgi:uncharacterized Zn finger protein